MKPTFRCALASAGLVAVLFGASEPVNAHQRTSVQAPPQQHHEHADAPDAAAGELATVQRRPAMMARLATLDARIDMFVAQMNSFTGDMKVEAMASVLATLIERQSMMRDEMMRMRDGMMGRGATRDTVSRIPSEVDPDTMCVAEAP